MKNLKYFIIVILIFPVLLNSQSPLSRNLMGQNTTISPDSSKSDTSGVVQINRESFRKRVDNLQERYRDLLNREEIAISEETVTYLWKDLQLTFSGESRNIQALRKTITRYFSSWNHAANLIIAALFIIGLIFAYSPLKRYLKYLRSNLGESQVVAFNLAGHLLEIAVRTLPTFLVMGGVWLVALVLDLPSMLYLTILRIAVAIVIFKLLRWFLEVVFAPEEVHHRLVPCNTKIAWYFFHIVRGFLQWTLLYAVILFVIQFLDYREDIRYLVKYIYRLGAILFFIVIFARRDFVLALIPDTAVKFYSKLQGLFKQVYYLIYSILLFTGVLSILGYSRLSAFIFGRAFFTVIIILGGILINHVLYDALEWLIPESKREAEAEEERKTARFWDRLYTLFQFAISAGLILVSLVLIAKTWWLLGSQSVFQSLGSLFTFTIFSVQDTPITPWSIIKAILIFLLFIYFSKYLRPFLNERVLKKTGMDIGARHAILTITHYLILVVGIVVAMESVGIQLTTLKVFAGALGLGIGFGLQNIANNFASGLIILFERPIKTKDFVHVGDILGTITKISARSTTILTRDNIAIIVPNSDFIEKTVINWSLNDTPTRVHIPIGVEYGTDADKVKDILLEIADEHPRILRYPRSRVWFKEFGDSSLDFELLAWINDPQEGINNIQSDINYRINRRFTEEGIGIPFPQRDIHIKVDDANFDKIQTLLQKPDNVEFEDLTGEMTDTPDYNKESDEDE